MKVGGKVLWITIDMAMASDIHDTVQILDAAFSPLGFSRNGKTWNRLRSETLTRIKLVKNRWKQEQYGLDWHVSVLDLDRNSSSDTVWHIVGYDIIGGNETTKELERCLNPSISMVSGRPRLQRLQEIMLQDLVPLLSDLETLKGIRKLYLEGCLQGAGVRTELQEFLS